jgi:hypothetical protein
VSGRLVLLSYRAGNSMRCASHKCIWVRIWSGCPHKFSCAQQWCTKRDVDTASCSDDTCDLCASRDGIGQQASRCVQCLETWRVTTVSWRHEQSLSGCPPRTALAISASLTVSAARASSSCELHRACSKKVNGNVGVRSSIAKRGEASTHRAPAALHYPSSMLVWEQRRHGG